MEIKNKNQFKEFEKKNCVNRKLAQYFFSSSLITLIFHCRYATSQPQMNFLNNMTIELINFEEKKNQE